MARRTGRRNGEKERFWRGVVEGHAGSGLSVRRYCVEHSVTEPSFFAWRRELARRDAGGGRPKSPPRRASVRGTSQQPAPLRFAQLQIAPSELAGGVSIEIVLPSGARVRVPRGACPATLRDVLAALERPAC
jgi:transposase-like protein